MRSFHTWMPASVTPSTALSSAARQTVRLLAAEPMARLPYLSCLPFQEALALAQPFLSQPEMASCAREPGRVVGAGAVRGLEPARHPGFLPRA